MVWVLSDICYRIFTLRMSAVFIVTFVVVVYISFNRKREVICSLMEMGRKPPITYLSPRCQPNTGGAGLLQRPSVSCHPDYISKQKFNACWSTGQICVRRCFIVRVFRPCGRVCALSSLFFFFLEVSCGKSLESGGTLVSFVWSGC